MTDKENVIKGLTEIYDEAYDRWVHRPYIEDKLVTLIRDGIPNALALLQEHEPVKPSNTLDGNGYLWRDCGECHGVLPKYAQYCPTCGRKVLWDD